MQIPCSISVEHVQPEPVVSNKLYQKNADSYLLYCHGSQRQCSKAVVPKEVGGDSPPWGAMASAPLKGREGEKPGPQDVSFGMHLKHDCDPLQCILRLEEPCGELPRSHPFGNQ